MNLIRIAALANKAKAYAERNPEKARKALTSLEQQVNKRTGGKYSAQVRLGSERLGSQLGLRPGETVEGQATIKDQPPR